MTDKNNKKPKTKSKDKPKSEPIKKEPTLKDKINKTVDDYEATPDELKKQIFALVQRVLYPDQFCPECDDRLFFAPTGWSCPNCGYQRQQGEVPKIVVTPLTPTPQVPRPSQEGKVPPQVEKAIQEADQNMKEPRRVATPTSQGAKIQKLVSQMDSGGASAPTPQDEAKVKGDKNASKDINWV